MFAFIKVFFSLKVVDMMESMYLRRQTNDATNVDDVDADAVAETDGIFSTMRKFRKREVEQKYQRRLCEAAQQLVRV